MASKSKVLKSLPIAAVLVLAINLTSCISFDFGSSYERPTKGNTYSQLYSEDPVVMLIMPPINNSANVDAKDFFYSTLNVPIADAGYYVLPPYLTLETLQRESAYDAELFLEKDLSKFKEIFGADIAVFTIIKSWNKSMLDYTVKVQIDYIFRSTKTNETLYKKSGTVNVDSSMEVAEGDSFLAVLANILASSISTAVTDYVDMAVKCNNKALADIPRGKYSSRYRQDMNDSPGSSSVTINIPE
ncbi:MAG: DUF799 domain-containing protein [Treponema sp.]|nr:DUF799 domain-containing protein [Treponema sp.]